MAILTAEAKSSPQCPAGCTRCPASEGGAAEWESAHAAAGGELRGGRLLARAACAFVVPIVGALAGTLGAGGGQARRFVGLAIGLASGMAVGAAAARLLDRRGPTETTEHR